MNMEWTDGGTGFLTSNGASLEYVTYGPPPSEAKTLVMLHEGLGCVALWRDLPDKLARATGMGVLAYSRAGYGRSDGIDLPRPLDYMTREAQDVLPDILSQAGIKRAVLLGHSDGASIAAIYAGSAQDHRVRGLILIAPHFFTEPEGLSAIAAAKRSYETGDLKSRLAKYHNNPDIAFHGWCDAWLDPGFEAWNIADAIDYIRVPTLAIQGTDDPYGTLRQIEEIKTRSYAPVDVLLLDGEGHAPHESSEARCCTEIAEFTARLARIDA